MLSKHSPSVETLVEHSLATKKYALETQLERTAKASAATDDSLELETTRNELLVLQIAPSISELMDRLTHASVKQLQDGFDSFNSAKASPASMSVQGSYSPSVPQNSLQETDSTDQGSLGTESPQNYSEHEPSDTRSLLEPAVIHDEASARHAIADTTQKIASAKKLIVAQLLELDENDLNIADNDNSCYLAIREKLASQYNELNDAEVPILTNGRKRSICTWICSLGVLGTLLKRNWLIIGILYCQLQLKLAQNQKLGLIITLQISILKIFITKVCLYSYY